MTKVPHLIAVCALAAAALTACASPAAVPAGDERSSVDVGELEEEADLVVAGTLSAVAAVGDGTASSFVGELSVTGRAKGSPGDDLTFRLTNASTREEDRAVLVAGHTYVVFLETFDDDSPAALTPGQAVFDTTHGRYESTNGSLALPADLREQLGL